MPYKLEYSEVHAFIKCKEAQYIAQKELENPRTNMVPIAHKDGQRFQIKFKT
jgi:hypothetical protein